MMGSKHIDPALCIHIGAYLICFDNKHLTDKVPRGNGTICRVLGFKLTENAQSSYLFIGEYNTHYIEKRAVRNGRILQKILCLFHRMYVRMMYHEISVRQKGERWQEIRNSQRTSNDGICVWLTPWNFTKFASSINR
jgi:hypothetical protein